MFEGFDRRRITTNGAEIFARIGGSGPPLLLLHGYPQSHVMWHEVAPGLARRFTLVIPDLRGYGDSIGPAPDREHLRYSKRVMAEDMIAIMTALGYEQFFFAGHDRGARVGYRLALDHSRRVTRLALLDILPTLNVWDQIDQTTAMNNYHWLLLAQPAPLPERLIGCDPEFFLRHLLDGWAGRKEALAPAAIAEYLRCFRKPSVIEAACEDYRAGASADLECDRDDHAAGRRIHCPTLLIWSKTFLHGKPAPIEVWSQWAERVSEVSLDCGHFLAEEDPAKCAGAMEEFFSA